MLRRPGVLTQLIQAAGFSLVTVENNHSGDLGKTGRDDTRAAFQNRRMLALDFAGSPQFLRIGSVTVAMVAITMVKAGRRTSARDSIGKCRAEVTSGAAVGERGRCFYPLGQ